MKKTFEQFNWFITQIKSGKTAIILSSNYVVMDWKTWLNFQKQEPKKEMMFVDEAGDEAGEITEEMWDIINKRLTPLTPNTKYEEEKDN